MSCIIMKQLQCVICREDHLTHLCTAELSRNEVLARLRKGHVCFSCLQQGHRSEQCATVTRCMRCGEKHPTPLCRNDERLIIHTKTSRMQNETGGESVSINAEMSGKQRITMQNLKLATASMTTSSVSVEDDNR